MGSQNCASCGAPIAISNRFSKVAVCSYCGTHHRVSVEGLDPSGKHPKLAEFPSVFSIGCKGTILGKPFAAHGRMRYGYDGGFFDEWFVTHDGITAWIAEDEGTYTLYNEMEEISEFPDISSIKAGQTVLINGKRVMIKEKGKAVIKGGEGELLYYLEPGTEVSYIDGITEGKKVSIEYTDNEIEFFTGRPLPARDIIVEGK